MLFKEIKKKLISLIIVLVLLTVFSCPALAAYKNTSSSYATAVFVINSTTGETFYSHNADKPRPPASTTKMLTSLLVLEAVERGDVFLDDIVTITEEVIETIPDDASRMYIPMVPDEEFTLHDLLYANMLSSDCMASNVLGAYISGSVDAFVELMNTRAQELGCENTSFTNPSGYPDENMYTTAYSLYLIASECMKHDLFREIVSTKEYDIPETNLNEKRTIYNGNKLLHPPEGSYVNPYYYEYAVGIKTGYSSSSGYCLVSASSKDGDEIFVVVLGGNLLDTGNDTYIYTQYAETLRAYKYFYSYISTREQLQNEFTERTGIIRNLSSSADYTRSEALAENEPLREAFTEKAETSKLHRNTIIYSASGAAALVIIIITLIIVIRKKSKNKITK